MTPIWNDEIEHLKQDPEASVFLVSFASQSEAKSTVHKLSFARQITKEGKTGLALPGHISFKVGKSPAGTLWILLAGRLSTEESREAYELFRNYGGERTIVTPSQVASRITGAAAAPNKIASGQESVNVAPPAESSEIKSTPIVPQPAQKPIEVASPPTSVALTQAAEPNLGAPAPGLVKLTPATEPVRIEAPETSAAIKPAPVVVTANQLPAKAATVPAPTEVLAGPEPVKGSSVQEPFAVKAPAAATGVRPLPIVVKSATEPVKVASEPEPAKVTPETVVKAAPSEKADSGDSPPIPPADGDRATTRIYLAREGARQGPFTLAHINAEIAAGHYRDDAFWAWHDGLPEWIPLYDVAGVGKPAKA